MINQLNHDCCNIIRNIILQQEPIENVIKLGIVNKQFYKYFNNYKLLFEHYYEFLPYEFSIKNNYLEMCKFYYQHRLDQKYKFLIDNELNDIKLKDIYQKFYNNIFKYNISKTIIIKIKYQTYWTESNLYIIKKIIKNKGDIFCTILSIRN